MTKNEQEKKNKLELLMADIDSKVAEFCELTGVKGKAVKKRWRDIKKQSAHIVFNDKVAELEKAILDYYINKGFIMREDAYKFQIIMSTTYKDKHLSVHLYKGDEEGQVEWSTDDTKTTEEMFNSAFEYFKRVEDE